MKTRRENIEATITDMVTDFLYYDRKEDEELPREAIEESIAAGEISVKEIVELFERHLKAGLGEVKAESVDRICGRIAAPDAPREGACTQAPGHRGECDFLLNTASAMLARLRRDGWAVAIHNDYMQVGEDFTFWLFTHPNGHYLKGEGRTDQDALRQVLAKAIVRHATCDCKSPICTGTRGHP